MEIKQKNDKLVGDAQVLIKWSFPSVLTIMKGEPSASSRFPQERAGNKTNRERSKQATQEAQEASNK